MILRALFTPVLRQDIWKKEEEKKRHFRIAKKRGFQMKIYDFGYLLSIIVYCLRAYIYEENSNS